MNCTKKSYSSAICVINSNFLNWSKSTTLEIKKLRPVLEHQSGAVSDGPIQCLNKTSILYSIRPKIARNLKGRDFYANLQNGR